MHVYLELLLLRERAHESFASLRPQIYRAVLLIGQSVDTFTMKMFPWALLSQIVLLGRYVNLVMRENTRQPKFK